MTFFESLIQVITIRLLVEHVSDKTANKVVTQLAQPIKKVQPVFVAEENYDEFLYSYEPD